MENSKVEGLKKVKNTLKGIQTGFLVFWIIFAIAAGIYIFYKVQQGNELSDYVLLITILLLLTVGMFLSLYVLRRSIDMEIKKQDK